MIPKYYPRHRKPQKEEIIPFSVRKPIELRSAVFGSGSRERGQKCLYELSLLLSCFKETSFSQIACATEIGNFEKCFFSAKKKMQHESKKVKQEGNSSKLEVNELLKKYSAK